MKKGAYISILARQAQRWLFAARQDQNPLVRMLHANYAVCTVDSLRQIASDRQIQEATGLNGLALLRSAQAEQDAALGALGPAVRRWLPNAQQTLRGP